MRKRTWGTRGEPDGDGEVQEGSGPSRAMPSPCCGCRTNVNHEIFILMPSGKVSIEVGNVDRCGKCYKPIGPIRTKRTIARPYSKWPTGVDGETVLGIMKTERRDFFTLAELGGRATEDLPLVDAPPKLDNIDEAPF